MYTRPYYFDHSFVLIATLSFSHSDRNVSLVPFLACLASLLGRFRSHAGTLKLDHCGVMHEPIDCSERHCRIGKDLAPFPERLIGRNQ